MPKLRDFLMRFRPAGPPGQAAPGRVPADRSAELAAELQPPLSLLEQTEAETSSIREQATADAASRLREAEQQAGQIVAEARAHALQARAEATDLVVRAAQAEAAQLLAAAERAATVERHRAEAQMPALVELVLEMVMEDIRGPGIADPQRDDPPPVDPANSANPIDPANPVGRPPEGSPPWAPDG